jgi:limonene-1,2-epoxide hydrolase
MTPQQTVEAFINAWNTGDMPGAFGMMADDIVWHNIPMEPAVGLAGVQALMLC